MNESQEEQVLQDEEQSEDAIVQNDFAQTSMPLIQVTDDNLRTYVVCVLTPTNNHPSLCLILHSNNYCCHDCQDVSTLSISQESGRNTRVARNLEDMRGPLRRVSSTAALPCSYLFNKFIFCCFSQYQR